MQSGDVSMNQQNKKNFSLATLEGQTVQLIFLETKKREVGGYMSGFVKFKQWIKDLCLAFS